jgi:hypothetical protein
VQTFTEQPQCRTLWTALLNPPAAEPFGFPLLGRAGQPPEKVEDSGAPALCGALGTSGLCSPSISTGSVYSVPNLVNSTSRNSARISECEHLTDMGVEMRGSAELQSTGERSHKGPKGSTGARPAYIRAGEYSGRILDTFAGAVCNYKLAAANAAIQRSLDTDLELGDFLD